MSKKHKLRAEELIKQMQGSAESKGDFNTTSTTGGTGGTAINTPPKSFYWWHFLGLCAAIVITAIIIWVVLI